MNKILKTIMTFMIVLLLIIGNGTILSVEALSSDGEAGEYLDPQKEIYTIKEDGSIVPETTVEVSGESNDGAYRVQPRARFFAATNINSSSTAVVNFRTKSDSTINTSYTEVSTGRPGYVNGYYAADAAFLGFDNDSNPTKVKFLQAGVIGWVNASDVSVYLYSSSNVNTTSKYFVSNNRLKHGIVTNIGNSSYSSVVDCGPKPSYLENNKTYFSYDGHYFYTYNTSALSTSFATMLDDYRKNTRSHAINASQPYYNYYQYLSHRSKTKYTASQLNSAIANFCVNSETNYKHTSKMRNLGDTFIENQNKYGVNALLMIGVSANESAWGCSNIAYNKNNLFGHAAYDSDPNGSSNAYSSPAYSIYYHAARYVSKGYLDSITDSRYYGSFLGDKASGMCVKYASDPYWGEKAASVAWLIDNYLNGSDSTKYTIAIKDTLPSSHKVIDVKNKPSVSSNTLYKTYPISSKTTYANYAPSNYAFIILNTTPENGYYKIQTDSEVSSDRSKIVVQEEYTFSNSYGYIPQNSVTIVNKGSYVEPTPSTVQGVHYSTHVQDIGWQEYVQNGTVAGTEGKSKRLESIRIKLVKLDGGIQYSTHIQNIGWQDWKSDGALSGTEGQSLRLEAIKIQLTGNIANQYDVYYRVHAQNFGWLGWAKNGESAGTAGYSYRLEAIQIKLVEKGNPTPGTTANKFVQRYVAYSTHVQNVGWQSQKYDGEMSGTEGRSLRLEGMKIELSNPEYPGDIEYRTHVQNIGWENSWKKNGAITGTSGRSLRLEAIQIRLTGEMANQYDVYYQVHAQNFGWLGWAKNGESAGTEGYSDRLEGIRIKLVRKGGQAPGNTNNCFYKK